MKKIFYLSLILSFFIIGCASTPKEPVDDNYAAFGCFELTMQNCRYEIDIDGVYKDNVYVHIKNNVTKQTRVVKSDENGFFYIDKLEKFVPYTIEAFGVHPFSQAPDSEWSWNWYRDFSISYEDVANLGDTIAFWDGSLKKGTQTIEYKKASKLYEEKFNTKYEPPVFMGPQSYSHVKSYADNTPDFRISGFVNDKKNIKLQKSKPDAYIKMVCEKIEEWADDDFEKARLAHDAVALILEYDADNYWKGTIPDQSYKQVLKRGTSVCAGYAAVYKAFCDKLRIPCIIVEGWAKGVSYDPAKTSFNTNHDWNIILIEGNWYFIDCTWDSGYMDVEKRKSVQNYNTTYLFAKPEHTIYSHYPMNPEYQLLEKKFTDKDIIFVPNLKPDLLNGSKGFYINVPAFDSEKGEITFELYHDAKSRADIIIRDLNNSDRNVEVSTDDKNGVRTIHIKLKEHGVYKLSINSDYFLWNNFASLNYF